MAGRSIPVITNPGVASRRPAPTGVFSVVGTLLSTSCQGGADPAQVQGLLGQASIETAARYFRAGNAEQAVVDRVFG
jgi:hypothetical protein